MKHSKYVICINNEDYEASLEVRKIYQVISDKSAERHDMIRVIDESDEDYIYPKSYFLPITLPQRIENAFAIVS